MTGPGHNAGAEQVRSYFDRWKRLEDEKAEIAEASKDLFVEAKSNGFSPKAMRAAFRQKVKDDQPQTADQADHAALVDLYLTALGTPVATQARVARVATNTGAAEGATSLSNERDDAQPEGGIIGGSGHAAGPERVGPAPSHPWPDG